MRTTSLLLAWLVLGPSAFCQNSPPRVISKVEPEYSEEARRAGVNALVLLDLVVMPDGAAQDIRVKRGAGFGLDEKAVETVQQWRFEPGQKNGQPVKTPIVIEISFRLIMQGRESENARLNFTLPPGVERPQLIKGKIPEKPGEGGNEMLRIGFSVRKDGKPDRLQIVKTTNQPWAERALKELKGWRFTRASENSPDGVDGVLELTVGHPRISSD